MTPYLWIKLLHILSATVLFGTGMGTAFFMLKAYLSANDEAMAVTTKSVVLADWIFTLPAVVVQFATGLWLTQHLNISMDSAWFNTVLGLFVFVGACWVPVVWIQIRIRDLIAAEAGSDSYRNLMRWWMALGVPAFAGVLIIFYLMVSKTGAYS
jgi:uncharacterized membrane protein